MAAELATLIRVYDDLVLVCADEGDIRYMPCVQSGNVMFDVRGKRQYAQSECASPSKESRLRSLRAATRRGKAGTHDQGLTHSGRNGLWQLPVFSRGCSMEEAFFSGMERELFSGKT